jgi:hypothetical protein
MLVGMGNPLGTRNPHGYGFGQNFIPVMGMGFLAGIFFLRGYGFGQVIPSGFLPIAISNCKRQRQDNPTLGGTVRICSSEGAPQAPPPGFAPPEGEDTIEDGEVIGISAEDQLKLRALHIKNNHLQKHKEILEAKRQRVTMQAKVRQMILDEEQRARELEQEITLIQGEGPYNLQRGPLA